MTRAFEDKPAARTDGVPLLVGLMGPSGGGKTYSALRLATGIQRVTGGDIHVIDTEARRALHYSDRFRFRHVEFTPPFASLDYLAAIEHCAGRGANVIIVDSLSHEHEGPGGLLEQHDAECQRLMGLWKASRDKVQMAAWAGPKSARRRMINTILQVQCHFIFCFRAKEKLKITRGKEPEKMGFMPIAGEEFVYEMAVNALLLPNADGVPTWQSAEIGERQMIKRPEQFRDLLPQGGKQLDEATGEAMARWAAGTVNSALSELLAAIDSAGTEAELDALSERAKRSVEAKKLSRADARQLSEKFKERRARSVAPTREPGSDDE